MNFLKIRVIINGNEIYTLRNNKPVVIPLFQKHFRIVATDGYHITKPVEIHCNRRATYLNVACGKDYKLFTNLLFFVFVICEEGVYTNKSGMEYGFKLYRKRIHSIA
jgi:hypothetical protein